MNLGAVFLLHSKVLADVTLDPTNRQIDKGGEEREKYRKRGIEELFSGRIWEVFWRSWFFVFSFDWNFFQPDCEQLNNQFSCCLSVIAVQQSTCPTFLCRHLLQQSTNKIITCSSQLIKQLSDIVSSSSRVCSASKLLWLTIIWHIELCCFHIQTLLTEACFVARSSSSEQTEDRTVRVCAALWWPAEGSTMQILNSFFVKRWGISFKLFTSTEKAT